MVCRYRVWGSSMSRFIPPVQLDLLAEDQIIVTIEPCPNCGCTSAKQTLGKEPHHAGLRCADCDRFIKWIAKPRREA